MKLIEPTNVQCEEVVATYDGENPFSITPPLEDEQLRDALSWLAKDNLIGLVDEEAGGIIGYVNETHADRIAGLLNAAAAAATLQRKERTTPTTSVSQRLRE